MPVRQWGVAAGLDGAGVRERGHALGFVLYKPYLLAYVKPSTVRSASEESVDVVMSSPDVPQATIESQGTIETGTGLVGTSFSVYSHLRPTYSHQYFNKL